jgi:nucleoside phosphorylase
MKTICLIAALPAEARPLISHFRLNSVQHEHLRLYQRDNLFLLQCGLGKLNAAANTATMLQALPQVQAVVNVGIAGSDNPLGTVLLAHTIKDAATDKLWHPHLPATKKLPDIATVKVVSVDTPHTDYQQDSAFDMEVSGIFTAATKVLDLAFIHSLKIVSDNSESDISNINKTSVETNIEQAIPSLSKLLQALPFDALPDGDDVGLLCHTLRTKLHYTQTEQHAVKQLLNRHKALFGALPDTKQLLDMQSAKAIRTHLTDIVNSASVTY